eukprot:scaffold117158_cov32-Tisochrysis_lutea.AAC.2
MLKRLLVDLGEMPECSRWRWRAMSTFSRWFPSPCSVFKRSCAPSSCLRSPSRATRAAVS